MIRIREPRKEELISEFDQKGGMKGGKGGMNIMNGVNASRLSYLELILHKSQPILYLHST